MIRRKLTKNPTRIGTSYFNSISDALRYYQDYDLDKEDVMEKIRKGEIHIGKPPVRAEEHIILDPLENRYFYQTRNPRKKVARTKVGRNPTMTKSEVIENWTLPSKSKRKERRNPFVPYPKKKREPIRKVDLDIGDLFRFYHGNCGNYKCKGECPEWSDHRYRIEPVLDIKYHHDDGLVQIITESARNFVYPYEAVKWG